MQAAVLLPIGARGLEVKRPGSAALAHADEPLDAAGGEPEAGPDADGEGEFP